MSNYNTAEVGFARQITGTEQFSVLLPAEFTGSDERMFVFAPQIAKPNAALFAVKDGDRHGKPVEVLRWRLNSNPLGKSPSAWVDFQGLALALWWIPEHQCYSVQKSIQKSQARAYEF